MVGVREIRFFFSRSKQRKMCCIQYVFYCTTYINANKSQISMIDVLSNAKSRYFFTNDIHVLWSDI